jgi:murein DD-endopeptidase MepM/ murein hydrolase activator NlpD
LNTLLLGLGLSGALAVAINYFQPKLLPSLLAQIPKLELDQKAVASENVPICPIKNCKDLLPEKGGSGDYGVVTKLRNGRAHTGLDFGAPTGTELVASFTGKISDWTNALCGTGIQITGTKWKGTYCHMNKVTVEIGKEVKQGEKVGEVGSTGHSTGPHLHFSLYDLLNKKSVNPRYEIQYDPAKPNTDIDLKPVQKPVPDAKKYNAKNNIVPKPALPAKKR